MKHKALGCARSWVINAPSLNFLREELNNQTLVDKFIKADL